MKIFRIATVSIVLVLVVLGSGYYLLAQSAQTAISCGNPSGVIRS